MSKIPSVSSSKTNTKSPKWTEEQNNIFGEILMEHYLLGNIPNGIPKKDIWEKMTNTLNHRLNTTYTVSIVLTRYKNMKSDFRTLFQLSNKSGWGWDEKNHLPTASDEIWEEVLQDNPSLARFRRNPFHQFDIFTKICGENIATENLARSTSNNETPSVTVTDVNIGEHNICHDSDYFLDSNGISFEMNNNCASQESIEHGLQENCAAGKTNNYEQHSSSVLHSVNGNNGTTNKQATSIGSSSRRRKEKLCREEIQMLVEKTNERTKMFERESQRQLPFTMEDCLTKLDSMPRLTNEGMLSVLAVLNENTQNLIILMTLTGDRLHAWINGVHTSNPRYQYYPAWFRGNDDN